MTPYDPEWDSWADTDPLETVTCSECGRVESEAAACWLMATPVCPECFVGPVA